jgi:hypothetical protein
VFTRRALEWAVFALLTGAGGVHAGIWTEVGVAGQTIPTAQMTDGSGSLDAIIGSLAGNANLFGFQVTQNGTAFSATTYPATLPQQLGGSLDVMLQLFDSTGNGIIANDDIGNQTGFYNNDAAISATLNAGFYFLGVSGYRLAPFDVANIELFPTMGDATIALPNLAAGPLDHYSTTIDQGFMTGPYRVDLIGAGFATNLGPVDITTPEPTSLYLLGMGAVALLGYRWRIRNCAAA